ncbi:MAG: helix-turn-helix domain-containing protein [Caulobacteraceae bacterium]
MATAATDFSAKLELALKALSLSRGRLAADLNVDKSLVGRWASGAVCPSEHNRSHLTQLIAGRVPGFTMVDWDRDMDGFAAVLGVDPQVVRPVNGHAEPGGGGAPLPPQLLETARATTARRGAAYEGFWRSTRPSVMMPGEFFHDHGMVRIGADGLLHMSVGGAGLRFEGWLLPAEGQLFGMLFDTVGMTPVFLTLNGTPLPKAYGLDGLVMAAALNAARTPSAYPIIFERVGDLTRDRAADDAQCEEFINRDPRATIETAPQNVRDHLVRDIGPQAAKAGGDMFLLSTMTGPFARGATLGGQLTG